MKRWFAAAAAVFCVLAVSITASAVEVGEIHAKGAILTTEDGQVLFEQNADASYPPASVTKIMTMLLTMEAVDSGKVSLEDTVTASAHAAEMGGSQIYLKEGEQMSLDDMLKSIAVASANDAAVAVAEHLGGSEEAFVSMMNDRAAALGCTGTTFVNPNGLDTDGEETKTTARDLALISQELLKHEKILDYTSIWMDTVRNGEFGLANTNKMLKLYDGMIGLKTGYTSTAGYCISAVAERDGMRLIAVVLGEPDKESRNGDIAAMLNYGFANYAVAEILEEGQELDDVAVELGLQDSVEAKLKDDTAILLEKSAAEGLTREIQLKEHVSAPVQAGDVLGEVILLQDGEELERREIVAADSVERKGISDIFRDLLGYLLMKKQVSW
ncbi:D-alanyl-D-alanine carboxypeptidase family protein [Butyricicoccus sp.]|uniref:D-alanyl-D-alanine carboxypeptidase family protein n=1 Tax=Butyricicoccus sp. TaxID=2049021 RepID=UPI003F18EB7F